MVKASVVDLDPLGQEAAQPPKAGHVAHGVEPPAILGVVRLNHYLHLLRLLKQSLLCGVLINV